MKKITALLIMLLTLLSCSMPNGGGGKEDPPTPEKPPVPADMGTVTFSTALTGASSLILSIENAADGSPVYDTEEVELVAEDGKLVTKGLHLKPGSYKLTKFLVANSANKVIYAAPRTDSTAAQHTSVDLPILFQVKKGEPTVVEPQVIKTDGYTAGDLGYVSFDFTEVVLFDFYMEVVDEAQQSVQGSYTVFGDSSYTFIDDFGASVTRVRVKEGFSLYKIKIVKPGLSTYEVSFTRDILRSFTASAPLQVVLTNLPPFQQQANRDFDTGYFEDINYCISGNYAYIGTRYRNEYNRLRTALKIVDISKPGEAVFKSQIMAGSNGLTDTVAFFQDHVYWMDTIIDVSNPSAPQVVNRSSPARGGDFSFIGGYLCVISSNNLYVYDVSDPANPTLKKKVVFGSGASLKQLGTKGSYLYLYRKYLSRTYIDVYDMTNPLNPQLVKSTDQVYLGRGRIKAARLDGDKIYITNDYSTDCFQIYSIADPQTPVLVKRSNAPAKLNSFAVSGGFLYVPEFNPRGDENYYLKIYKINADHSLTEAGSYWNFSRFHYPLVQNNMLYYLGTGSGLRGIDVTNPAAPVLNRWFTRKAEQNLAANDRYIFSAAYSGGFSVYDRASLKQIKLYDFKATDVAAVGNYAYVSERNKLTIWNMADSASFGRTAVFEAPGRTYGRSFVYGNYFFINVTEGGVGRLKIMDVTSPGSPSELTSLAPGALRLVVKGNRLYTMESKTVKVYDFSIPAAPELLGEYDDPQSNMNYQDIAVKGNFMLVLSQTGLKVLEMTSPGAITEIKEYSQYQYGRLYEDRGDYFFINLNKDFILLDVDDVRNISEKQRLSFTGAYMMTGHQDSIIVSGGLTKEYGITVIKRN